MNRTTSIVSALIASVLAGQAFGGAHVFFETTVNNPNSTYRGIRAFVTLTEPATAYLVTMSAPGLGDWASGVYNYNQTGPFPIGLNGTQPQIVGDSLEASATCYPTNECEVGPGTYTLFILFGNHNFGCPPSMPDMTAQLVFYGELIETTFAAYSDNLCCVAAGCAGDVNDDCKINIEDLLVVLAGWSLVYDITDLLDVLANWGWCHP